MRTVLFVHCLKLVVVVRMRQSKSCLAMNSHPNEFPCCCGNSHSQLNSVDAYRSPKKAHTKPQVNN